MEDRAWLNALANGDTAASKRFGQRRRFLLTACISLTAISLVGLISFSLWTVQPSTPTGQYSYDASPPPPLVQPESGKTELVEKPHLGGIDPLGPQALLKGPPTARFRDNLRSDVKYISSWAAAGWTNDVFAYVNLIYLGLITDHVPVLPMFTPSHIGGDVPPVAFGDVFDVPRLRKALGKPIIEWRDVKDPKSEEVDDIGCWSVWEAVQKGDATPRDSAVPKHLKLDISYTKAPEWIKYSKEFEHDPHASFWALARFAYPNTRAQNLIDPRPSEIHGVSLHPDEQMLCFDFLYYVCAHELFEFEYDFSPAWNHVAKYMHFVPSLEKLADTYVNRALGFGDNEKTPPYIGIHVRHNDFQDWCFDVPLYDCFAKIPVIARRVQEVKDEILQTKGLVVNHVIMTSDERNETWWKEIAQQGWFWPDHSKTTEIYGDWYPPLIDATIQSRGLGFVGTDRSTMSVVAKRRVEVWNDGITRLVRWGTPEADDH